MSEKAKHLMLGVFSVCMIQNGVNDALQPLQFMQIIGYSPSLIIHMIFKFQLLEKKMIPGFEF